MREKHSSLLPVGIEKVVGRFDEGDLVEVRDSEGNQIARGVTLYDSEKLKLVLRKKSPEIHALLGKEAPEVVIHKNDLVVF